MKLEKEDSAARNSSTTTAASETSSSSISLHHRLPPLPITSPSPPPPKHPASDHIPHFKNQMQKPEKAPSGGADPPVKPSMKRQRWILRSMSAPESELTYSTDSVLINPDAKRLRRIKERVLDIRLRRDQVIPKVEKKYCTDSYQRSQSKSARIREIRKWCDEVMAEEHEEETENKHVNQCEVKNKVKGKIKYEFKDTGNKLNHGSFGRMNQPMVVLKTTMKTIYVEHISFLKIIDQTDDSIIYEKCDKSIEDWVRDEGTYDLIRNSNINLRYYVVRQELKGVIKSLLTGILYLEREGLCFDGDLQIEHIVMVGSTAKFMGLGVRKAKGKIETERDLFNLARVIEDILGLKRDRKRCPSAMKRFIHLLKTPRVSKKLLVHHCALMDARQCFNYLQKSINEIFYTKGNVPKQIEKAIMPCLRNWTSVIEANKSTILYSVYNYRPYKKNQYSHFQFLRNFAVHVSAHSQSGNLFIFQESEALLSSSFPHSVYLLQEIQIQLGINLEQYVPRMS